MSDGAGIPTSVDFDEDDVKREAAQTTYREKARVKTVCVAASIIAEDTKGKGPGRDFVLKTGWQTLDPKNGTTPLKGAPRFSVRNVLPMRDPENKETHLPPEYAKSMWAAFCEAAFPEEYPPGPRMEGGVLKYLGLPITEKDKEKLKVERAKIRQALINKVLADQGKCLLRTVCYGTVKISGDFTNLNNMRAEEPKEGLTPEDELFTERLAEGTEDTGAPATAKEKAAPKRARR